MPKKIYTIPFDMTNEESKFINQLVNLLSKHQVSHDLKVVNLVAIIGYEKVIISETLLKLIQKTDYYKAHGLDEVERFFQQRAYKHIQEANDITFSKDVVVLTSVSSRGIRPSENITSIPGEAYHQDGRGIPVSTKITLVTKRIWTGGTLHLIELPDGEIQKEQLKKQMTGKKVNTHPGQKQILLNEREAVIFSNKETLHAVDPNLSSNIPTNRTIYQERINNAQNFNFALLAGFGIVTPLYSTPSMLSVILSNHIRPALKGKRFKSDSEMTPEEMQYKLQHEEPDRDFQRELSEKLGKSFNNLAKQFEEDGVIILPGFFSKETMEEMQKFFDNQISLKKMDPLLNQASFNGAVDKESNLTDSKAKEVCKAVTSWPVLSVIGHYLGHPPVLANWRGYRLGPSEPVLYRAWDWHNDQKRKEVKIMVLLTDVNASGQAMQVIKGSHKHWWNVRTQADTKFNIDESLSLGSENNVTKCFGPAGTLIFFDTNILHRGARSMENLRDVMTFNFLPNKTEMALFPISMSQENLEADLKNSYRGIALTREKINDPKAFFIETIDTDEVNNKYDNQKLITTEQDTSPAETIAMVEEYYETPTYEHIKPRYDPNKMALKDFFLENALNDLSADIDLEIRFGKGDVDRDIQFVVFRDRSPTSPASLRLKEKLSKVQPDFSKLYTVDDFIHLCRKVMHLAGTPKGSWGNPNDQQDIMRCGKLAQDLEQAFGRADTLQRLRSTILYLYSIYDRLNEIQPSKTYQTAIDDILAAYTQIICLDDYNDHLAKQKGYGYFNIGSEKIISHKQIMFKKDKHHKPEDIKAQLNENMDQSLYRRVSYTKFFDNSNEPAASKINLNKNQTEKQENKSDSKGPTKGKNKHT